MIHFIRKSSRSFIQNDIRAALIEKKKKKKKLKSNPSSPQKEPPQKTPNKWTNK